MSTPLVIDHENAVTLASSLAALTGESVTASIVAALSERLARERQARVAAASRAMAHAIAVNLRAEGRYPTQVPAYGWCRPPVDDLVG